MYLLLHFLLSKSRADSLGAGHAQTSADGTVSPAQPHQSSLKINFSFPLPAALQPSRERLGRGQGPRVPSEATRGTVTLVVGTS